MNVAFPGWARISIGVIFAAIAFVISGDVFTIEGDAQQILVAASIFLAGVGVVPAKPGEILAYIPQKVGVALTAAVTAGSYFFANADIDPTLRGIVLGILAFLSSQLIVPGQAKVSQ